MQVKTLLFAIYQFTAANLLQEKIHVICRLGLENPALGLRPRAAFSSHRSQFFTIRTSKPANNIYFPSTPCEIPNTSRCVVVTHLFTVLFHGLRKHTNACEETQKVCNDYTPLRLFKITHLKICLNTP